MSRFNIKENIIKSRFNDESKAREKIEKIVFLMSNFRECGVKTTNCLYNVEAVSFLNSMMGRTKKLIEKYRFCGRPPK